MNMFKEYPQIIAAIIAGAFALICQLLELRGKDSATTPTRGFSGWLVIIAAAIAVALSLYSVAASRSQLNLSTWSNAAKEGAYTVGDTLVCYGFSEVSASPPDVRTRIFSVTFPDGYEFVDPPVVTDGILSKGGESRANFGVFDYDITTKGFTVRTWNSTDRLDSVPVRYNWMATGRIKH